VWLFENMSILDSKSIKFSIIDLKTERKALSSTIFYFSTISSDYLSFWRIDSRYKLEGFHVKLEYLLGEYDGETLFTSLELSDYYENIRTSFVMIGTSNGALLIVDKEKKLLIKKYLLVNCPITHISLGTDKLIICGNSPVILSWDIKTNAIDTEEHFDFLTKNQSVVSFVSDNVKSVDFLPTCLEGLVCTQTGSIVYINLLENESLNIVNSHGVCNIKSLNVTQSSLISAAK
jgi:hypothetical protein